MKKITKLLACIILASSTMVYSAMENKVIITGIIKSFDAKMVIVETKSGAVKIPRHFFKQEQLKEKNVKVVTTHSAMLASN